LASYFKIFKTLNDRISGKKADKYEDENSHQTVATDLEVSSGVGTSTSGDTSHIGVIMGNLLGDVLTKTRNYLFGVAGKFSITGSKSTTYPAGGVLGIVADGVTDVDGAVVAVLDGDSSQTIANAAFKAKGLNSTPGSGFTYGVDLFDDGGSEYPDLPILNADVRLSKEVCVFQGAGVPTDAVTGAGFAEIGSLYLDRTNGNAYLNANTKASPTWKLITRAA